MPTDSLTDREFAALCRHLTGRADGSESARMDAWLRSHRYAVEVALHTILRRPDEMVQEFDWELAQPSLLTALLLPV
ncbi:MAG TPA: hypothetical protein VJ672_10060 [Gemmatimonadaceae bacterium]|nr:hypothetical protein [Gemmatimonadaceae bacterium]